MDTDTAIKKILNKSERSKKVLLTEREFLKSSIGTIVEMAPNKNPRNLERIVIQARDNFRKYAYNDNEWYSLRVEPNKIIDLISALLDFDDFMCLNLTQNEVDRGVTDPDDPNRSKYKFSSLYDVETSESWRDDFIDIDACVRNIECSILFDIKTSDNCFCCTSYGYKCVDCINRQNLTNNYEGSREPRGKYTLSCKYDCYKNRYICCHECQDACEYRCTKDVDECENLAEDNRDLKICRESNHSEKTATDTVVDIIVEAVKGKDGRYNGDC